MAIYSDSAQFSQTPFHMRASVGYTTGMKDSGLRIRVQRGLRDRFLRICRAQDKPAAQVLREYMRTYIDEHKELIANETAMSSGPKAKGG